MSPRIPRVYADTSVFGGILDEEFQEASRAFFDQVQGGRFRLVSSAIVEGELREAPPGIRQFYASILPITELAEVTTDVIELQQAYLAEGVLPPHSALDALHVALAACTRTDIIVSWNFKHIVHFDRIRRFNAVNQLHGWDIVGIYSPKEVIDYEDKDV